jgi:hypothetical protein
MAKTQVYSWRMAAETKAELQRAAKRTNQSVGGLPERIVGERLDALRSNGGDLAEQQRLHAAAAKCIGFCAAAIHTALKRLPVRFAQG